MPAESLSNLNLKYSYSIPKDNITSDFIIPALRCAKKYDRAAGYFTSGSLIRSSIGMCTLAKNGGKVRLLTSPRLSVEDIEAMNKGYEKRRVIENALVRELKPIEFEGYKERMEFLANLIAFEILDIKICFLESNNDLALFHPKFGLISDDENNTIYFNGSMNESINGIENNWEYVDVLCSWENEPHIKESQNTFDRIWNNEEPGLNSFDLPAVAKELILSYKTGTIDFNLDDEFLKNIKKRMRSKFFSKPEKINFRKYQLTAINTWSENEYRGIFNMATGTGKTITALGALEKLCNSSKNGMIVFIVCPYKHLVEQWAEQIKEFGVTPLICHSESPQVDWKSNLDNCIRIFNGNQNNNTEKFYCIVTTNNTFGSDYVQKRIEKINGDSILVVDEVHNIGSEKSITKLNPNFKYRLGLSATINRFNDVKGTELLRKYFGCECIEYTLKDAISSGMLVKYEYHPIPCVFTSEEYTKFNNLNKEIEKINDSKLSKVEKLKRIKEKKIAGSRLVSGIESKYKKLEELISEKKNEDHMLIYCGDANIVNENIDPTDEEYKFNLVERTTKLLGNKVGINISKFTYHENMKERRQIKEDFENGSIQALVAIRCLDEGVDIPSIKTAFITSSGENPKEYIQRRGRVLRLHPGKDRAIIFDFIAIPVSLDEVKLGFKNDILDITFLKKEIKRIKEFSSICINPEESNALLCDILDAYGIDETDLGYNDEC